MAGNRKYGWQFYLKHFKPYRGKLTISVVLAILQSFLYLPIIFMIKRILNDEIADQSLSFLIQTAVIIAGLIGVSFLLQIGQRYLILHSIKRNTQKIRNALFKRYYEFPKSFTDQHDASYLYTILIQDLNRLDATMKTFYSSFVPSCFMIAMLSGALMYINLSLFGFVVLLLPILALLIIFINHKLKKLFTEWRESVRTFNRGTLHILEILHLTKIQNAEEYEKEQMRLKNEQFTSLDIKIQWLQEMYQAIRTNWIWLMGILVIIIGGVAVLEQDMTIGDVFLFYIVFNFMKKDVSNILGAVPQFINGKEALNRFSEVYLNETKQPYLGVLETRKLESIELKSTDFAYVRGKPVLEDIYLTLESGNIYLIKGKNGSGKTTLMHLILGFYKPDRGVILANDVSYEQLDIKQLRSHFGIVLQESPLFSGTIVENITYGHENVSREEVLHVCQLATVDDFLSDLEFGIDTPIGEKGVYLSGGQRQKIAIARALVSKPDFIILDEPTNHLDHPSIRRLMANLKSLPDRPGLIIISHDEALLPLAEYILEFEGNHLRSMVSEE